MLGLSTLIFMIVAGVTIAILATHFMGGSIRPQLEGDAQTASIFHRDFPETAIGPIIYPKDRRTAFFLLQEGHDGFLTFSKAMPVLYQARMPLTDRIKPPYKGLADLAVKLFAR